jgi:hypothetical protein
MKCLTRSCRARSYRVHRREHGRDYAAPLQWKLPSLTSKRLGCSEYSNGVSES